MANCQNSEDVFHQEYPTVPEEAFISTGRPVFDVKALGKALITCKPPLKTGRVVEIYDEKRAEKRVVFQSAYNGHLHVWEEPQDGEEYVIGIDVALGKEGGDYSCMQVVKKRTAEVVAVWHGHIDPDLLGAEAAFLGRWYKLALLVPEANNHGLATIISLRRHRYPRIFRRRSEGKTEDRVTRDYGWMTTVKTKPQAIAVLTRIIRENAQRLTDADTIRECMSYVIGEDGKTTNAQEGCHDDRVMALAIAYRALDYNTFAEEAPQFKEIEWREVYQANATTGY